MSLRAALLAALGALALPQVPARAPDIFFVPTWQPVVYQMLELASVTKDDVVYDLGSGDGRIVIIAAQKYGARGVGIELDPKLVEVSRQVAREAELSDRVTFIQGDLFQADISAATVVTLFLSPSVNAELEAEAAERAASRHPHRLAPVPNRPLGAGADSARARGSHRPLSLGRSGCDEVNGGRFLSVKSQVPNPKSQRTPNFQTPKCAGALAVVDLGVRWSLGFGTWDLIRQESPEQSPPEPRAPSPARMSFSSAL